MAHSGSWSLFGIPLPDFGVTEAFASDMGSGSTGQGGSDIFPNKPQAGQSWSDPSLYSSYNKVGAFGGSPVGTPQQALQNAINGGQQMSSGGGNGGGGNTGGGGGGNGGTPDVDMSFYKGWNDQNAIRNDWANTWQNKLRQGGGQGGDMYGQLRNDISSGWDNYLNQLQGLGGLLGDQRTAQENTAQSQYGGGVTALGTQRDQGQRTAEQNQVKTLRDIASNIKNALMAGNVYLGSRGAGDSSAANQYSYALSKEGTRQRSDVMQETAGIIKNIQDTYNMGVNQLKTNYDTQINKISEWFAGKQMEIKQALANGQLNKSQDLQNLSRSILDQAISAMNQAKTEMGERQSALESWAMSNSQNISQLSQNMRGAYAQLPQSQGVAGTPQIDSTGNMNVSTGYGGKSADEIKRLLGLA